MWFFFHTQYHFDYEIFYGHYGAVWRAGPSDLLLYVGSLMKIKLRWGFALMSAAKKIGLALLAYGGYLVFEFGRLADELVCRAIAYFARLVKFGVCGPCLHVFIG